MSTAGRGNSSLQANVSITCVTEDVPLLTSNAEDYGVTLPFVNSFTQRGWRTKHFTVGVKCSNGNTSVGILAPNLNLKEIKLVIIRLSLKLVPAFTSQRRVFIYTL